MLENLFMLDGKNKGADRTAQMCSLVCKVVLQYIYTCFCFTQNIKDL